MLELVEKAEIPHLPFREYPLTIGDYDFWVALHLPEKSQALGEDLHMAQGPGPEGARGLSTYNLRVDLPDGMAFAYRSEDLMHIDLWVFLPSAFH